jgi:flagellar hook-associated protein 3 FlgL
MNNIWRNARHLNDLVTQIETGKRIQRPSDDPLASSRSLRYRTILSEAEQFIRNVNQGMAWMEVSEAAFNSVLSGSPTNPSLMNRIYTRLVEAAQTGTQTLEDQRAILAELQQYFEQMFNVDMNQTYLGRYVFSGFHTNEPPVLKQDLPGRSFFITQEFVPRDIERAIAFHRPTPTDMPSDIKINVIKLPFTHVEFNPANVDFQGLPVTDLPTLGITLADGTDFEIIVLNSTDTTAYRPEDFNATDGRPIIHYLRDTGELVMSDEIRALIDNAGGLNVTYEKSNLRAGELNPVVYFNASEIGPLPDADGNLVLSVLNYNTLGQNIQMEVSPNAYITINSHARNILTSNLFSDLRRLFEFAGSLVTSDPRVIEEYFRGPAHELVGDDLVNAVQKFMSDEQAMFSAAMHDRINNMLREIMEHAAQAQREHTNLGARMARLEMIGIRLEEDEVAYTELLSDNEDTDLSATIMRKLGAEAAFGHALRAIAISTQLTLADFINR